MPYMMGGFPDMETSRRIAEAYADGGADLVELGFPFSDPLADGPVVHAAGTAALRAGATTHEVLAVGRALAERVPVVAMIYANLVLARGLERFADDLAAHGISRPDRPRPAARGVRRGARRRATRPASRSCRWWRRRRPTERMARIGASARGFVYAVSVTGTTGERAALADVFADDRGARQGRAPRCRSRVGFGIGTPRAGARGGRRRGRRRHRRQPAGARRGGGRRIRRRPPSTSWWRASRRPSSRVPRHMGLVVVTTAGLVVWLVMWALGVKAIDSFMITVLLVLVGATVRIIAPYLPGNRDT